MAEFSRTQYNFNNRFILNDVTTNVNRFALVNIPSISDSVVLNTEDEKPQEAGMIDYGSKIGKGIFTLPVTLCATSLAYMSELIEEFKEAFNPDLLQRDATYGDTTSYLGYHPLTWTEIVGPTTRNFRIFTKTEEVPKVPVDAMSGLIRDSDVKFKLADPRKYLQEQSTLTGNGTATNSGNYTTPVVITITASGATSINLTLANSTTGEFIHVTTALSSGDVLVIDTGLHSVKKNGVETRGMLSGNTQWWFLNPGANVLAATDAENTTIVYSWYSAWAL